MDVNGVLVLPVQRQTSEEGKMFQRDTPCSFFPGSGGRKVVTGKCLQPTDLKKKRAFLAHQILEKEKVVITHKSNHAFVRLLQ